jgi:hypothetical protein
MSRAHFTFRTTDTDKIIDVLTVDLFDTPGSRAWQYAVLLTDKTRTAKALNGPVVYCKPGDIDYSTDEIATCYQQLLECVDQLKATPYPLEETVPALADIDQHFLNRLHRHFTTTCRSIWSRYTGMTKDHLMLINDVLHRINAIVHALEKYYPTTQKLEWNRVGKELEIRPVVHNGGFDIAEYGESHSFEPADMILDAYILGKTLLESYFTDDDPRQWDTMGHTQTNGGCNLVLTDHRQQMYNSDNFQNWLKIQAGLPGRQVFGDFRLGNFISGHRERAYDLFKYLTFKYQLGPCEIDIEL